LALSLFIFGALKQAVDDADVNFNTNEWISPSEYGKTLAYENDNDEIPDVRKKIKDSKIIIYSKTVKFDEIMSNIIFDIKKLR
jgi:hypothetical protein